MTDSAAVSPLPPAIVLVGPTAGGKSALAVDLVERLAGELPIELVSVDSAQVFIDMDIGTAKPDAATRARVPHHLLDLVSPEQRYSAGRFVADALQAMKAIRDRGHLPLLTGGTMLYIRALTDGIAALPPADAAIRAEIDALAAQSGWPAVHAELARHDPQAAARIDPNHSQRLQRALELVRVGGRPLAELFAAGRSAVPAWRFLKLALVPSTRSVLHERIAERFRAMLAAGLVDEVAELRHRYVLRPEMTSMRCVGYRQAWERLDGLASAAEMEARGIAATRQLAKRQLTWLRSMPDYRVFDTLAADSAAAVADAIRHFVTAGNGSSAWPAGNPL